METKKFTRLSMLLSFSIVLGLIENFIPIFNGIIPGLKIGLANTIIIIILYSYSFKDALYVSMIRVFIISLLVTGLFNITFYFSLVGATFSVIMMSLFKRTKLSIIGVSIIGSLSHSIGQILVAIIFLKNTNLIYYLPWLLIFSIPTGIIIGIISKELLKYTKDILK